MIWIVILNKESISALENIIQGDVWALYWLNYVT